MWLPKKTSAVKHKPVRNGGSGRPNNILYYNRRQVDVDCSVEHCQLDYCNALLAGTDSIQTNRLQSVQNIADRLMLRALRREHITPRNPRNPQWLLVLCLPVSFKADRLKWKYNRVFSLQNHSPRPETATVCTFCLSGE